MSGITPKSGKILSGQAYIGIARKTYRDDLEMRPEE